MKNKWGNAIVGVIFGILTYVCFNRLLDVFQINPEDGTVPYLIHYIVPLALSIAIVVLSLNTFLRSE